MSLSKALVEEALAGVPNPTDGSGLVQSGAVKWVAACDAHVSVKVHLPDVGPGVLDGVAGAGEKAIRALCAQRGVEVTQVRFEFVDHAGEPVARSGPGPTPASQTGTTPRHTIAVGAGKGGVGKSTVAVNLAVGLARRNHAVGLLDGDIYGPSLPTMLGLGALEQNVLDGELQPFLVHGVKAITLGKLVDPEKPLIWRGPMAHGAFKQLTDRTNWGELDHLVIDLPPGTGDVPLTMAQSMSLTGAVIVCTPQRVAQDDAVRAVRMFQQLGIEILGVVENMSYFVGDDSKVYDIFGRGGAEQMAQRLGLPFLGAIPINTALRRNLDEGTPLANFDPASAGGEELPKALDLVLQNLEAQINLASMAQGQTRPSLSIS